MNSNKVIIDQILKVGNEGLTILKKHKLLEVLARKLLISESLINYPFDEKIVSKLKDQIFERNGFKSDDEYKIWLAESNLSEEEFFENITLDLRLNKYVLDKFGHLTESHFLKNQDNLDKVVYSLIRTKDIYLANELYQRIKEKEDDFGDLAYKYSIGPEKNSKGIVGPVSVSSGHPLIKELIRSSTIGEIQKPKPLNNMVIIFRLESLDKATLDEKTKLALAKELFMLWATEQSKLIIDSLELK